MKITLTKTGHGSKVFDDAGNEIKGVTSIEVRAGVDMLTEADIGLIFIDETKIEDATPHFYVGAHGDVVALIQANGNRIELGAAPVRGEDVDWRDEYQKLADALDPWKVATDEEKRTAFRRALTILRNTGRS